MSHLTEASLDLESRACSPLPRLTRLRHLRDFPPPPTLLICVRGLLMLNSGDPTRLPEEPGRGDLYDNVAGPRQHPEIGDDYPRVGVLTRLQEFVSYLALQLKCTIDKTHPPLNQLDVGRQDVLHVGVEGVRRLDHVSEASRDENLKPRDQRVDGELGGVYEALSDNLVRLRLDYLEAPQPPHRLDYQVNRRFVKTILSHHLDCVVPQRVASDDQLGYEVLSVELVSPYRGPAYPLRADRGNQPQRSVGLLPDEHVVTRAETQIFREVTRYRQRERRVPDLLEPPHLVHAFYIPVHTI